jgi:hypothetical protein
LILKSFLKIKNGMFYWIGNFQITFISKIKIII